ncbi:hypothetical protein GCM10023318_09570 [Nocardia callitridis]|uniref:Uncharacterized protein n=1 Tax=Nocardia callitridis TaxID=648753 RepID=A0ABP9JWW8_9NOCA
MRDRSAAQSRTLAAGHNWGLADNRAAGRNPVVGRTQAGDHSRGAADIQAAGGNQVVVRTQAVVVSRPRTPSSPCSPTAADAG